MKKKQTTADAYASVFAAPGETRAQRQLRREREAVLDDAAAAVGADRDGCAWCQLDEAHLHGAVLFENGKALF